VGKSTKRKILIDCEVVINEKENIESASGVATEHVSYGKGLVKFLFNTVVNLTVIAACSYITYSFSSPVI
jgi:hypothetical protein